MKVGTRSKRDKVTGEAVTVPVFGGCHSVRRGFASTQARRGVTPFELKTLMRHSSVVTSEFYYLTMTAADVSADLWRRLGNNPPTGNTSGNIESPEAESVAGAPDAATWETPCDNRTYASGGQGIRTLNGLRRT